MDKSLCKLGAQVHSCYSVRYNLILILKTEIGQPNVSTLDKSPYNLKCSVEPIVMQPCSIYVLSNANLK